MADTFDPYHVWLGIPPEERPANHYRLLGLREFETNSDVITNALDQRRAHLRSVQSGKRGLLSQQLLNEVSAAGVCLLDAAKKQRYDDELRAKLTPVQSAAAPESPIVATSVPLARVVSAGKVPDATAATTPGPIRPAANSTSARQPMVVASPFTAPANTVSPAATAPARASRSALPQPLVLVAAIVGGLTLLFLLIVGVGGWMLFKGRQPSRAAATPPVALPTVGSGLVPAPVTSRSATTGAPMLPPRLPPAANDQSSSQPPAVTASPQGTVSDSPRFALVFTGKESVEVPLPPDLLTPGAEFTIELWARWDPYEPAGRLFGSGVVGLYCREPTDPSAGFNRIYLKGLGTVPVRSGPILGGKWQHLAVTHDGLSLRLFVDGTLAVRMDKISRMNLEPTLVLGNISASQARGVSRTVPPFSGMIRDLRISRGVRYVNSFTPEGRFAQDAQTAVLLDMRRPRQWNGRLENLTGQSPPAVLNAARRVELSPPGEIAGEMPGGNVDLLKVFDIDDHSLELAGTESPHEGSALTGAAKGRSRYLIPYRPPAEYDVELELTRLEGEGGAFLGLEVAEQPVVVIIGAYAGHTGLLLPLADSSDLAGAAAKLHRTPNMLVTGQRAKIHVTVRFRGIQTDVSVQKDDGDSHYSNGDPITALKCPREFAIPAGHGMSFGSIDAKIRFHKLLLRPTNNQYSSEVLAAMASRNRAAPPGFAGMGGIPPLSPPVPIPGVPFPPGMPVPLPLPPGLAAPPPQPAMQPVTPARLPVPAPDKLLIAIEETRKIYEPRFKQATKPATKSALAKEIQTAAEGTSSDPVARYALFDLSRKVNVQASEIQRAIALAKRLEQEYEIPPQEIVVATVEALDDATLTSEQRSEFVKTAADLADAALSADLYERADKLAAAAAKSASRLRDADLRKEINERRASVTRALKGWNALQPSLEKLKAAPNDSAAILTEGKFYCFTLEDFDRGLPLLAAGDDAALAPAAKLDLAAKDAAQRCAAAESWRQAAAKIVDRDDRLAVQRRERWLLQQSLGGLQGLEKIKASKRLEELKDAGQLRLRATKVTNRVPVTPAGLLIGRVQSNGTDAGLLVTYEHGYLITADDFARLMAAGVSPGNVKIVLQGIVTVPSDQVVSLWHDGGTSQGRVHRVFFDDREVSSVGDGHSKVTTGPRLQAGAHLVRWELSGGDFGAAQMEISSQQLQSGGPKMPFTLVIDGAIQAAARSLPTKASIHFGKNTR